MLLLWSACSTTSCRRLISCSSSDFEACNLQHSDLTSIQLAHSPTHTIRQTEHTSFWKPNALRMTGACPQSRVAGSCAAVTCRKPIESRTEAPPSQFACMYVCMYVYMYVCAYVCMYICMYVCVCVEICMCVYMFMGRCKYKHAYK
jgi:hypothetical protein